MAHAWQFDEAKARFAELVDVAWAQGSRIVIRSGVKVAVVLSYTEYRQLKQGRLRLGDFLSQSPLAGAEDLDLDRDRNLPGPDIAL
jgi:prevent-host-death family protein